MIHIQSTDNPLVKHLSKLRTDATARRKENKIVLSGRTLITEVAQKIPLQVLITEEPHSQLTAAETFTASPSVLKKISGVENPDGYIAVVGLPPEADLTPCRSLLALDGVSDPGNFGTLLRSALAFGWDGVFLLPNTCDPYNDKALRSARGAQFHLRLRKGTWQQLKELSLTNRLTPIAADLYGKDIRTFTPLDHPLLILGNEGQGIDATAASWCEKVTIPMLPQSESLNVSIAGSILMFLLNPSLSPHG
ncbi:MAG: RNA methyltransferase [Parachlamydiales bacterium]|jgi:TrmH family RNA methyltransferase